MRFFIIFLISTFVVLFYIDTKSPILRMIGMVFNDNCVYVLMSGNNFKLSNEIKKFNILDTCFNHVSLGIAYKNDLKLYHINTEFSINRGDNLNIDFLSEYLKKSKITHIKIYKISMDSIFFKNLKYELNEIEKNDVYYDFNFSDNNNFYYCSEFIIDIFFKSKFIDLREYKVKRKLSSFLSNVMQEEYLSIYPIDFVNLISNKKEILDWSRRSYSFQLDSKLYNLNTSDNFALP
ncbi:MAG: hypothetical protein MUF43_11535 [Flavobacterium sp.]|jgi:hypothetical protein|nr:hypothetical protein [Flavobacterium sp.]